MFPSSETSPLHRGLDVLTWKWHSELNHEVKMFWRQSVRIMIRFRLLTIALFCIAHFLEGDVVTPLVERKILKLLPALTLAVQLLLASVAGDLDVALAAPFTAVVLGVADVLLPSESSDSSAHPPDKGTAAKKFDARVKVS